MRLDRAAAFGREHGSATRRALLLVALCVAWLATIRQPVHAYSSFGDYVRTIEEGGGGGRLFTGTPADSYGCDVCHRGARGSELDVAGLPEDGYVPGMAYEILLQWPATTPHVALMAEVSDLSGQPAGLLALAPYDSWQPGELCEESGFPAADLCRAGGASAGCCRDLEPSRDACSFPGERSVLWLLDCGSRFARFRWTAPAVAVGDVWFSSSMVTSDLKNDSLGDGVTLKRQRLRALGDDLERTAALGDCRAIPGSRSRTTWLGLVALLAFVVSFGRCRRRKRARA